MSNPLHQSLLADGPGHEIFRPACALTGKIRFCRAFLAGFNVEALALGIAFRLAELICCELAIGRAVHGGRTHHAAAGHGLAGERWRDPF